MQIINGIDFYPHLNSLRRTTLQTSLRKFGLQGTRVNHVTGDAFHAAVADVLKDDPFLRQGHDTVTWCMSPPGVLARR